MKKLLFALLTIIWLIISFVPFGGLPAIGQFLMLSSGYMTIKPPEFTDKASEFIQHDRFNASIHIDTLGIPHIFSEDDESADFAMGYLHARDRMLQMELIVRMMQARLSEFQNQFESVRSIHDSRCLSKTGESDR